jgi:dolichol-phosphate mannosyltransferase
MADGQMKQAASIGIILPTYCEEENVSDIINSIEGLGLNAKILVIDDSSPDNTEKVVRQLQQKYGNIFLLKRPYKMGLGTAITDGFKYLLSLKDPPDYIITMDADRSHNPKDIPKLLQKAMEGSDLVVGSRYCAGGKIKGWTTSRLVISKIANKIAQTIIKLPINDYTSGFRCYSREYIKKALPKLHSQTYEIQIETLRQAKLLGLKVGERPVTFENRKRGKSKLTPNEIATFLKYILKTLLNDILKNYLH